MELIILAFGLHLTLLLSFKYLLDITELDIEDLYCFCLFTSIRAYTILQFLYECFVQVNGIF